MTQDETLADAPQLADYYQRVRATVGERDRYRLGVVDALLIRRYAVAIGDPNPLYHDADAARAAGHQDIIAPPNLLAAVVDWTAGPFGDDLGDDGTAGDHSLGGLRVMGAGEDMEIERPVCAGSEIFEDRLVESVDVKRGRSGPLVFVTMLHELTDADGTIFNRNRRTILVRPL